MCRPTDVKTANLPAPKWVLNDYENNNMSMIAQLAAIADTTCDQSSSLVSVVDNTHLPSTPLQVSPFQQFPKAQVPPQQQQPPPMTMSTKPWGQGGLTILAFASKATHPQTLDCLIKNQSSKEGALQEMYKFQCKEQSQQFRANTVSAKSCDEDTIPLVLQEAQIRKSSNSYISQGTLRDQTFHYQRRHSKDQQQERRPRCPYNEQQQQEEPCHSFTDKTSNSYQETEDRIACQSQPSPTLFEWETLSIDDLSDPLFGQDDEKQKIDCFDNFYDEDLLSIQSFPTTIEKDEDEENDFPESSSKDTSAVAVAAALSKTVSSVRDTEGKGKRKRCLEESYSADSALVTCLRRNNATSANAVKTTSFFHAGTAKASPMHPSLRFPMATARQNSLIAETAKDSLCHAGTNATAPPSKPSRRLAMATSRQNSPINGSSAKDDTASFDSQQTQQQTTSVNLASQIGLAAVNDASIAQLRVTAVPPSVLASLINAEKPTSKQQESRAVGLHLDKLSFDKRPRVEQVAQPQETPQDALERILSERGYHLCRRISAEEASYDMLPSALQLASYGMSMVRVVETQNVSALQDMLSAGLSPNPCNEFGDSVLDWVCKTANTAAFACFVQHGCEVRVSDKFGRTPLHHCCWSGTFSPTIASALLERDLYQLFIQDRQGETPLEYIRRPELANDWVDFLESTKDTFFPPGGKGVGCWNRRRGVPLPDPPNAIAPDLAAAIASGAIIAPL